MVFVQGKGLSQGVARGVLTPLSRASLPAEREMPWDPEVERQRLALAVEQALEKLAALQAELYADGRPQSAELLQAYMLVLEEEDFSEGVQTVLLRERCNAETAVTAFCREISREFQQSKDAYIRARADDLSGIAAFLTGVLRDEGIRDTGSEEIILFAEELSPMDLLQYGGKKNVKGFLTGRGSYYSHIAIFAREHALPLIRCMDGIPESFSGLPAAVMDGYDGRIVVEPDAQTLRAFKAPAARPGDAGKAPFRSGRMRILCNVSSSAEAEQVLANDGQGIGLLRSEFFYMQRKEPPCEEELAAEYQRLAMAMAERPVVIRTMDIRQDKRPPYVGEEQIGAADVGSIRFSLREKSMLRVQLRAIYRASAYGKLAILFPMITAPWEFDLCRSCCAEVMEELRTQGIPFREDVELGIMVETPAAVLLAEELASRVDFFSIGTNDLTQHLLCCDRQSRECDRYYDPHSPAVLRSIEWVVRAAHRRNRRVCICGELAHDPSMLKAFLQMGVDALSAAPAVLPQLYARLSDAAEEKTAN